MPASLFDVDRSGTFQEFVKLQARLLRGDDASPASVDAWESRKTFLREQLIASWGGFPKVKVPLEPKVLGELKREGYRVEKLLLQTRPEVWMTANAYVPEGNGPHAAVLCVHGHWKGAKQDPTVQARCIGLAKLGFFVLVVDAFGAGERAIGKALGEYHGQMTAATLWPTGLALAGLQVWDNIRAIDYLQSRPEVDPLKIGVTGASGGGNQSMYIGAIDERLQAVVPTCSVGTYQAYLGAACCMCEMTPGALTYTEEAGVLSLVAPRALMLISATRDAFQFSVGEAARSLEVARHVYGLYGAADKARHAIFESGHDYSRPMREAMYGWMKLHLLGQGDGSPVPEPEMTTEEPETLRCFPGESRPEEFITLPRFAALEGRRLLSAVPQPAHREHWQMQESSIVSGLSKLLGKFPPRTPLNLQFEQSGETTRFHLDSEPGIPLVGAWKSSFETRNRVAILLDLDAGQKSMDSELAQALGEQGWSVASVDLRATASSAHPRDTIGAAPDHNTTEWSLWIGRPLLGQWVWDTVRVLEGLQRLRHGNFEEVALVGLGPAGVVALAAAVLSTGFHKVATWGSLGTLVSDVPYVGQRMGILAPGLLRDAGDIAHLAATISPRPLIIANPLLGSGDAMPPQQVEETFRFTRQAYRWEEAEQQLQVLQEVPVAELAKALSIP